MKVWMIFKPSDSNPKQMEQVQWTDSYSANEAWRGFWVHRKGTYTQYTDIKLRQFIKEYRALGYRAVCGDWVERMGKK